jgi:hypothetical protein
MTGPLIVSTATDSFFEHLRGLVQSIRNNPRGKDLPLGVLDLNLTPDQRRWLDSQGVQLKLARWHENVPQAAPIPEHYRALCARPYLEDYFPGYEVYLWLDADTWVQHFDAIDLLDRGARSAGLAVVPEIDRASRYLYGLLPRYQHEVSQWYTADFGADVGRHMCTYPMLNAGVWAMRAGTPHWRAWAEILGIALKKGCSNLTDQLALNLAVYCRELFEQTQLLPGWVNWMCHGALPRWDQNRRLLVETYLPHTPIGVLHLTGKPANPATLRDLEDRPVNVSLSYPPTQATTATPPG